MIGLVKDRIQALRLSIRHLNRINPNVMVFVVYGMLYDMMLNLHNPFAAKFLERLGGGSLSISLINSLPGMLSIFALLPGLLIVRRFRSKKKITAIFIFISRLFLLFLAFIPSLPPLLRPVLFILLFSLMNIPHSVSQSALQSFLGTVFDGRMRSTAISMRTKFGNVIIPVTILIAGFIIGAVPEAYKMLIYQIFFAAAFIVGCFETYTFLRFKEPSVDAEEVEKIPLRETIKLFGDVLKDKTFLTFLVPIILFYYAWHSGWALGSIYFIMILEANEFWIGIFLVVAGISSFFTSGLWNRLIQRSGNDFTIIVCAIGIAFNMFFYALCKNVYTMTLCHIFSGAVSTGLNIALLNGLLAATPDKNRMLYIGVYNTLLNISLAIAPLVAQYFISLTGVVNTILLVGALRLVMLIPLAMYVKKRKKTKISEA